MRFIRFVSVLSIWILIVAASERAGTMAQAPIDTVWSGVYSAEQAARGKEAYDRLCSACHQPDLRGGRGSALIGDLFWSHWGEDSIGSLFDLMKSAMPRGEPGSLTDAEYLDITTYVLQSNGYPAGSTELTPDRLARVRITRKEGAGPVPNFSMVAVVGCLSQQPAGGKWVLDGASEPVRTRNPGPSAGSERERVLETKLGTMRFELMDVYTSGTGHDGHKMEVKGLLIRGANGAVDKLNVIGLNMLDERCAP